MLAEIFGRPGCSFCVRAQALAEKIQSQRDDFQFHYIDIYQQGISKADMAKKAGKPVETVPQIFLDQVHIGGFTEFNDYVTTHALLPD
ncbi:GrxA family glutaredoxin [Phytohalomonas tamaricis]|uniref:GrxA family glutaredoxin n=1 Tax=Phytohalomonas tamaricis TaxID=2081032 RepID=UPI000D0BB4DC|nr:GrxA family glutaredoxin [Phytohalomonas tamaricis]